MEKKYVTKEGLEKMKGELEDLKTNKRKEISERLKIAISFGDLSENFDYSDAREQQEFLERKIAKLEEDIRNAEVVEESRGSGEARVGSVVEVEGPTGKIVFGLVTANEANPMEGKISVESPIGEALRGKKKGEKATIETPGGSVTYTIIGIQ